LVPFPISSPAQRYCTCSPACLFSRLRSFLPNCPGGTIPLRYSVPLQPPHFGFVPPSTNVPSDALPFLLLSPKTRLPFTFDTPPMPLSVSFSFALDVGCICLPTLGSLQSHNFGIVSFQLCFSCFFPLFFSSPPLVI